MPLKDALLPEYDHEFGTVRRLIERAPDAELAWKPHDKSMSLGRLATHLATLPQWSATILNQAAFDLAAMDPDAATAALGSRDAILKTFDANVSAARATLAEKTDAELLSPWTLKRDGEEIFTLPRVAAFRSFVLNHAIHHRGQLSVYLRLKDIPVPAIYGPSADEGF
jgi:uncharacterized damage-inducible protein DinB